MTTTDPVQNMYAKYEDYPNFSYKCIKYLMDNNEDIWKLLKYNGPDALDQNNLTYEEKAALIYKGEQNATPFRVFMDIGQPDVWTEQTCIIRICPWGISPDNLYYGTLYMSFEAYAHYRINTLNNYQTRVDRITGEFLKVFNGTIIGGIGRLFINKMEDQNTKIVITGQLPFRGKQLFMSNKSL